MEGFNKCVLAIVKKCKQPINAKREKYYTIQRLGGRCRQQQQPTTAAAAATTTTTFSDP